jgi:hypothetical protein
MTDQQGSSSRLQKGKEERKESFQDETSTHGKTWSWAKKSCRVVARENELEKDG